jgi:hypothetical protein
LSASGFALNLSGANRGSCGIDAGEDQGSPRCENTARPATIDS